MITKKSVEEVLSIAKVEEVIGDFVNLKRSGSNMMGLCPFHHEKSPSFSVSPSKNIYKCFGCGKAGGPVQFIMEHESSTFPDAVRYLAKKYNIPLEEIIETRSEEQFKEELKRESYSLINEFTCKLYQDALFNSPSGKTIGLAYFKERGFLDATIKAFQLGYAPESKDFLVKKCEEQGYNIESLDTLGLTNKNKNDFFHNRVIFPIHNITGKVIAFSGRKLGSADFGPKYINSPETPLYTKSKVLYGMHLAKTAIRSKDECLLVEGYTDVISLHQAGIQHVVASSGTSLTQDQIRLIKRFTSNIKVLYDGDAAGIKASLRALELILEENMNVRLVILPDPEDPDSFVKKHGSSYVENFLQEKAIDFVLFKANLLRKDTKNDPIKKAEGIADIVHTIAKVPDALKRSTYIQSCAAQLEIAEDILVSEVNKTIKKNKLQKVVQPLESKQNDQQEVSKDVHTTHNQSTIVADDEYQERSLVRVLINYGHLSMEDESGKTLAQYINENMEGLHDEFNNKIYERMLKEYIHELSENRTVNLQYFIQHKDKEIQMAAIDLSSSPFGYSANWAERWEMELQTQRPPDENYVRDCYQSILRFKLKKVQRMILANKKELDNDSLTEVQQLVLLKTQHELSLYRNTIAEMLGMRVLA